MWDSPPLPHFLRGSRLLPAFLPQGREGLGSGQSAAVQAREVVSPAWKKRKKAVAHVHERISLAAHRLCTPAQPPHCGRQSGDRCL